MECQLPTCRSQDPSDCVGCAHKFKVKKMLCSQCNKLTSHAIREDSIPKCMICGNII